MEYSTDLALRALDGALGKFSIPPSLRRAIVDLIAGIVERSPATALHEYALQDVASRVPPAPAPAPAPAIVRSHRDIASTFYKASRKREELVGPGLLYDPVWYMMLDMFMAAEDGRSNTVGSLTMASGVANTTALRYIDLMKTHGLLSRTEWRGDTRKVRLEPTAKSMMIVGAIIDQVEAAAARPSTPSLHPSVQEE